MKKQYTHEQIEEMAPPCIAGGCGKDSWLEELDRFIVDNFEEVDDGVFEMLPEDNRTYRLDGVEWK